MITCFHQQLEISHFLPRNTPEVRAHQEAMDGRSRQEKRARSSLATYPTIRSVYVYKWFTKEGPSPLQSMIVIGSTNFWIAGNYHAARRVSLGVEF